VKAAHLPASVHPVKLHFRFYEPNRKRDLDNISGFAHKVIQDALVSCGVLGGDGWKYITGYTDEFFVDKQNPRIEVEIEETT
jgi:Holliday junction resolvase RusA-like endonuclease